MEGNAGFAITDYRDITPGSGLRALAEYYFPTSGSSIFGLRLYAGYELLFGADKFKIPDNFSTNLLLTGIGGVYSLSLGDWFFPFASAGVSAQSYTTETPGGRFLPNLTTDHRSLGLDAELGIRFALTRTLVLSLSSTYHYISDDNLDGYTFGIYPDFYATAQVGISYAISFGSKYEKVEPQNPKSTPQQEKKPVVVQNEQNGNTPPIQLKISPIDTTKLLTNKKLRLSDITVPEDTMSPVRSTNDESSNSTTGNENSTTSGRNNSDVHETGGREKTTVKAITPKETVKAGTKPKDTQKDKRTENKKVELSRNDPPAPPANKKEKTRSNDAQSGEDLASNSFEVENVGEIKEGKNDKLPREILLHGELTFYRDDATIQPEAYAELNKIAQALKKNPKAKWVIEGYTDNQGNETELQKFSYQRATAIMKYLSSKGVPSSKFKIVGMGSKNPVEDNSKVYGRMMNRRIVIKRVE